MKEAYAIIRDARILCVFYDKKSAVEFVKLYSKIALIDLKEFHIAPIPLFCDGAYEEFDLKRFVELNEGEI